MKNFDWSLSNQIVVGTWSYDSYDIYRSWLEWKKEERESMEVNVSIQFKLVNNLWPTVFRKSIYKQHLSVNTCIYACMYVFMWIKTKLNSFKLEGLHGSHICNPQLKFDFNLYIYSIILYIPSYPSWVYLQ